MKNLHKTIVSLVFVSVWPKSVVSTQWTKLSDSHPTSSHHRWSSVQFWAQSGGTTATNAVWGIQRPLAVYVLLSLSRSLCWCHQDSSARSVLTMIYFIRFFFLNKSSSVEKCNPGLTFSDWITAFCTSPELKCNDKHCFQVIGRCSQDGEGVGGTTYYPQMGTHTQWIKKWVEKKKQANKRQTTYMLQMLVFI